MDCDITHFTTSSRIYFILCYFLFHYQGETPYKIDRSVNNWQKAILAKHGEKNRSGLCTDIPAHAIIQIRVIGV